MKQRLNLCFDLDGPVQRFSYHVISTKRRKKSEYAAAAIKYYAETVGDAEGTPLPVKKIQLPSSDRSEPNPNDLDLSDMLDSINNYF